MPFCRRTSTLFPGEWICGEHWRLVDRSLKRLRTRLLKRARAAWQKRHGATLAAQADLRIGGLESAVWEAVHFEIAAENRLVRLEASTWRRIKAQAAERAAGV